jgi:DNA-binding response OmpR family regulator
MNKIKKILVIDDDLAILDVLRLILEYSGYEVVTLSHADVVFETVENEHPDLILLDVMLAGLDGKTICQNLKKYSRTKDIPVIMISASHDLRGTLSLSGAPDDFIAKPFDLDILVQKVEQQLAAA